jgi:hypothetical protein
MKLRWYCCAAVTLVTLGGCGRGSGVALLGKWTNHHVEAKQPAIVSIEFLPKNAVTINAIDAFAATGWHSPTTSTGEYQVVTPNRLKVTEGLGSTMLEYHINGTRLVLSGDGLAQLLGKAEPLQTLDKTSQ